MSMPESLRAYEDCRALYDKAAEDPKGARACSGTYEAAVSMRRRMHYFRKLDRRANAAIYEDPAHPMHGVSTYDDFTIVLREDTDKEWWLYIERNSARVLAVEGLSEVEAEDATE